MRIPIVSFVLATLLYGYLGAQQNPGSASQRPGFVLVPSKPYVYLQFDHIASRAPLVEGEPHERIWLRLENNCDVSIVVMAFVPSLNSSAEAAVAVSDEVVPTSSGNQGDGSISTVHYKANEAGYTDIFLSPNLEESEVRAAEDAVNEREGNEKDKGVQRPHGYNDGVKPGVQVLKVIPPGGELLFSLPITHVSKQWHIEVPFRFALEHPEKARQPYSYVAFFWDDLPEEYRSMGSQPAPAKPNPSEGTILHESGHPGPPKQP